MKRNPALDNNDHDMARWLTARDWQTIERLGNCNQFFNGAGDMIAVVIYDNTELTTTVYTEEAQP